MALGGLRTLAERVMGGTRLLGAGRVAENISRVAHDELGIMAKRYPSLMESIKGVHLIGEGADAAIEGRFNRVEGPLSNVLGFHRQDEGVFMHIPNVEKSVRVKGGSAPRWSVSNREATVEGRFRRTLTHEIGHAAHDHLADLLGKHFDVGSHNFMPGDIMRGLGSSHEEWAAAAGSTYAGTKPHEAFAEVFASVHQERASEAAHRLFGPLHQSLAEGRITSELSERLAPLADEVKAARAKWVDEGDYVDYAMDEPARARRRPRVNRGRHSTARQGLPIRSSAPPRFRSGHPRYGMS